MNWLMNVGDTDILRDATSAAAVFSYRARRGKFWTSTLLALAALTLALLLLVFAAPADPRSYSALPKRETLAIWFSALAILLLIYGSYVIFKFLPSRNDRVVLNLRSWVRSDIDPLEAQVQALSDEQLRARTAEFRRRLAEGESLERIRPEAYACVREASRRARSHRQFECQLIGGRVIENCNVAEMRTGEGKTIVCYVANYMKVLQGLHVHMVTVNDYLVRRDAEFCKPIFELLGITVGFISSEMETYGPGAEQRREAYGCDITYGTNSEFGFDYLRDNMKMSARDQVQGPQDFVVVDEVDSILIDEARTPLIISGPAHDDVTVYRTADNVSRMLVQKQEYANRRTREGLDELERNPPPEARGNAKFKDGIKKFRTDPLWLSSDEAEAIGHMQYFVVELDRKSAHMTDLGAKEAQRELGIGTFYESRNMNWPHYIDNALRAHLCYQLDKEYVIQEDTIVIVDEFTGRLMHGRQWSDGLHQAVEAKEKVTIKQETQTLATITLQNLFKLYKHLAGMTGTAMTESEEFMKIYKLEVVAIPTNRPVRRIDYNDKIYKTGANKYDAVVEEIHSYAFEGVPADVWSMRDILKTAEHTFRDALHHRAGDAATAEQQRIAKAAIDGFETAANESEKLRKRSPQEAEQLIEKAHGDMVEAYRAIMDGKLSGRPLLVGTCSVEHSEKLSQLLTQRYGIEHEVLNAKNHAREAEIVAKAGQQHETVRQKKKMICGNVTIATNMAGRGTDIRLGEGVAEMGGLHVVGTERHESRRIDNQLRGRCGRQGDPGSSRFFLSLDDELLRLFMGEWVLRMLNMIGFEEGMAIDDRRLNKGIERAQKKVEERNFGIRKNLLEYDEVMDYQRKTFYALRQRVVEGRGLSELIWEMIDEAVADAVSRYFDPLYPAQCAAEWVGQHLKVTIDPEKLDMAAMDVLTSSVRDLSSQEAQSSIERVSGEYIDRDTPPEEWDLRGVCSWAAQYGLTLTQGQVRDADPEETIEKITRAALATIETYDLTPLEQYVDPLFPRARLARWCREKFEVDIPLDELARAPREDAEQLIRDRMRAAYRRREIEYPVGAVMQYAAQRGGQNANEVYARIAAWANRKFNLGWTYEHFAGREGKDIYIELTRINEDYLTNGKLDHEIDAALKSHSGSQIVDWAKQRFGTALEDGKLDLAGDLREQLRRCGYEMLRYELTQLERVVLLNAFDAVWKDHMYAMDLLRSGIWMRGQAERDPKIEYKREGTRMFNEMMSNIRERVTDLIFKVQLNVAGGGEEAAAGERTPPTGTAGPKTNGSPYGQMQAQKADATGAGFQGTQRDRDAAMSKQGEAATPQTIRREAPKVGRNDPCPCGSGKKYKQCHGRNA